MPGRLAIFDDTFFKKDLKKIFPYFEDDVKILKESYNVAPTNKIPIFLNSKKYTLASFGLISSYAKDNKTININARSETIFEKVTFREAFKYKRCLLPINGFYEWKKEDKIKKPFFIYPKDNKYFALAAIYEYWFDEKKQERIISVALITTEPNSLVSDIHDRMPVILNKNDYEKYLNETSSLEEINKLLTACLSSELQLKEVGPYVNSVKNNSKKCLELNKSKAEKNLFDF